MKQEPVHTTRDDDITTLTIDRPPTNAMSHSLSQALATGDLPPSPRRRQRHAPDLPAPIGVSHDT